MRLIERTCNYIKFLKTLIPKHFFAKKIVDSRFFKALQQNFVLIAKKWMFYPKSYHKLFCCKSTWKVLNLTTQWMQLSLSTTIPTTFTAIFFITKFEVTIPSTKPIGNILENHYFYFSLTIVALGIQCYSCLLSWKKAYTATFVWDVILINAFPMATWVWARYFSWQFPYILLQVPCPKYTWSKKLQRPLMSQFHVFYLAYWDFWLASTCI